MSTTTVFVPADTTTATATTTDISNNFASSSLYQTFTKDNLQTNIFTATNFILFVWFLGVLLIIFFLISPNKSSSGRLINIILIVWLIYLCSYLYLQLTDYDQQHLYHTIVEWTHEYFNNDSELLVLIIATIVFYILIYVLNVPMTEGEKPFMVGLLEDKFWILIFMFIILLFFKYVFGINLNDIFFEYYYKLENAITQNVKIVPTKSTTSILTNVSGGTIGSATYVPAYTVSGQQEVFNIDNNLYTYDDAQAICKSYGARLATYDDIEQAYNDGAEWCSYGWSDGQMAYFPTQKSTWQELQKNPKYKNNCGRPGVNGGYMDNPNLKFGVNCYGVKPKATTKDTELMNARKQSVIPKSAEDVAMEQKIEYWKNANISINSFNKDKWSEY